MEEADTFSDQDEYDYEETTVMVELQGIMENDFLGRVSQAKILGIDTEKPLLQLDDYTFTGQYSDTMGTNLVFQDKTESNAPRTEEKKLEYSCLTNKKLSLQRVFLKDNNDLTNMDITANESFEGQSEEDRTPQSTGASPGPSAGPSAVTTEAAIDEDLSQDLVIDLDMTSENSEQTEEAKEKT